MNDVVAVVNTYNSKKNAQRLIDQLIKEGSITRIIVCDDTSTDGTVEYLRSLYRSRITVLRGTKNFGPGGNRNKILRALKNEDAIFFMDADCALVYQGDLKSLVLSSFASPDIGAVGFGVLSAEGKPMRWNYGDFMHPTRDAAEYQLEKLWKNGEISKKLFIQNAPKRAASLRMLPETGPKPVDWVAESCFAVRSTCFKELKGFSNKMRYHETHEFNIRVKKAGYTTIFNPTTVARHDEFDSRFITRNADERQGRFYYFKKHWQMSEQTFALLFEEKTIQE